MVAGFAHAPITKGILITISITSILISLFQLKPFIHLQIYPHIAIHHHWYRLVSQHVAFTNSSELFLALLLFYNVGVKVERTLGTSKFAGFLVVTTALYTVVQFVVLSAASFVFLQYVPASEGKRGGAKLEQGAERSWLANGSSPSGPWAPLFAILYQYHRIIPYLWSIRIGSLTLTDKHIQTYTLAALLAFSQPPSTLVAAGLAMLVSALYRSSARLQRYRLPLRLYRVLGLLLSPWIGQTRLPQRSWRPEYPHRRTLAVREARVAAHNQAVQNANRTAASGALGMPRIASLLRRRTGPPTQIGAPQGDGAAVLALGGVDANANANANAGARGGMAGWNDVPTPLPPPNTRAELERWQSDQVSAALHGRDPAPDP